MSNQTPNFDAVFILKTAQILVNNVANTLKSKPHAILEAVNDDLFMIHDALRIGINRINELKASQDLNQDEACTAALADQQIRLDLKDKALQVAIQTMSDLNAYQDEVKATFNDGKALALTLMNDLANPSQQTNTALYDIAEELYFLLSARANA